MTDEITDQKKIEIKKNDAIRLYSMVVRDKRIYTINAHVQFII